MKLIIDIPEDIHEQIKDGYVPLGISKYLKNGIPLDDVKAENKEEAEEMTNEEILDKVLRNFFPRALFIREINEASHTKRIIFSDEWLKKPYKGGE